MMRGTDPLGKRALFSVPTAEAEPEPKPKTRSLDVAVHCSSCDRTTTLTAPQLLMQHFPLWAWVPGRNHAHFMRCPACNHLAWHAISRVL